MVHKVQGWVRDVLLRALGLLLLTCCWLLMSWLFSSAPADHPHELNVPEFAAAALGFLCFSAGAALSVVGIHLFGQVEISQRWARP